MRCSHKNGLNIAFIPVRGGSASIPLKNIKLMGGHPLVWWTAKAASEAECIDKVVIATDHPEIKKTVLDFRLDKLTVYDRLEKNARHESSTESVMLEYLERGGGENEEWFFLIQATSPFLTSRDIERAWDLLRKTDSDSLLTAVANKRFFWTETGVPINYDPKNRPRRQDHQGVMMENGALYIYTAEAIKRDLCRIGGRVAVYEMPEYTGLDIDEPHDWLMAEALIQFYGKR